MCKQWLIYTVGEGRDLHVSLIFLGQAEAYLNRTKKFSTQLFENVSPPGHYKENMGVNNKFPDFTL